MRAELIPGAKPKRELFEDAVPILFNHKPLPKKRKLSLDRQSKNANQDLVENAMENYEKEIESNRKTVFTDTNDLISTVEVGVVVGKSTPKLRSTKTQWKESDFERQQ